MVIASGFSSLDAQLEPKYSSCEVPMASDHGKHVELPRVALQILAKLEAAGARQDRVSKLEQTERRLQELKLARVGKKTMDHRQLQERSSSVARRIAAGESVPRGRAAAPIQRPTDFKPSSRVATSIGSTSLDAEEDVGQTSSEEDDAQTLSHFSVAPIAEAALAKSNFLLKELSELGLGDEQAASAAASVEQPLLSPLRKESEDDCTLDGTRISPSQILEQLQLLTDLLQSEGDRDGEDSAPRATREVAIATKDLPEAVRSDLQKEPAPEPPLLKDASVTSLGDLAETASTVSLVGTPVAATRGTRTSASVGPRLESSSAVDVTKQWAWQARLDKIRAETQQSQYRSLQPMSPSSSPLATSFQDSSQSSWRPGRAASPSWRPATSSLWRASSPVSGRARSPCTLTRVPAASPQPRRCSPPPASVVRAVAPLTSMPCVTPASQLKCTSVSTSVSITTTFNYTLVP
mmetsp:Transcript_58761/g.108448  ORF Transcript_58761/g.108448 Transcript_58761/m.108448 type:complete len:465 (+) Transcript_58761:91-1485(+)